MAAAAGAAAAAEAHDEGGRGGEEHVALTGAARCEGEQREEEEGEEEAEEFSCSAHCSELSRRQNHQRKAGLFCDVSVVLVAGEEEEEERTQTLVAHRSVLSAASQYFALLLGGNGQEQDPVTAPASVPEPGLRSGRVELRGWSSAAGPDPRTVESVLQFMYTGEVRVSRANVHEVLELADRFLLVQLKSFCAEFLLKKLTLANCAAVHSLALMYSLDRLAAAAAQTIRRNFHRVIVRDEFLPLPFHLVRGWLSDPDVAVDLEQELFQAAVRWVGRDPAERRDRFQELFGLLRLSQMTPSYLAHVVRKEPLVAGSAACLRLVSAALEFHAVRMESRGSDLDAVYPAPAEPRPGQFMDVILVTGGVTEGEEHLSECVGYLVDEDRWVNLPHIRNHLDGHAVAVCGGHVYVAGSTEPGFAKMVERYDPGLNSWEPVSSMNGRKHSLGLVDVRGVLYSIGGHGGFSPGFRDVSVYEPEQDEWISLEPAPKILRDVKAMTVDDRYVYVTARTPVELELDQDDGLCAVTACYDTETCKWQEVPSLPLLDNYCHFQMAVASTAFYHTSSWCPKNYEVSVQEAQDSINSSSSGSINSSSSGSINSSSSGVAYSILDSLPPELLCVEGAAVCHLDRDIFVIGGWRSGHAPEKQHRREAYRYSAQRKRWTLLPPLPQARSRAAACHIRIPYRFVCGEQRFPVPLSAGRLRSRAQQHQLQQHRLTLTRRRQLQAQIEC